MWPAATMITCGVPSAMAERVLIDTSAFYAIISDTDSLHRKAQQQYQDLIDREAELYTTSYVLLEAMALMHRRLGFDTLKVFVESIQDVVQVYWVTQPVHDEAWQMMVAHNGGGLSLVDCSAIVVAKKIGALLFAFDQGFAREGVPVVPRPSGT